LASDQAPHIHRVNLACNTLQYEIAVARDAHQSSIEISSLPCRRIRQLFGFDSTAQGYAERLSLNKLAAMRGPAESYSDVILRLVEQERRGALRGREAQSATR